MAKTEFQLRDLAKIQEKTVGAFQDPPLIDAPFTTITDLSGNPRQLPDPSKTLKPALASEPIYFRGIEEDKTLRGPDGERVFKPLKSDDLRVRFVGDWLTANGAFGTRIDKETPASTTNYLEVTFRGTGLNLLMTAVSDRDIFISVDGGVEGSDIGPPSTSSSVIGNRNYALHNSVQLVSGLAYGTHTVKIRSGANDPGITGVVVLNEDVDIQVPKGEILKAGKIYRQDVATSTTYNTGFDGNPTLNGKGGRVLVYKLPGDDNVYKAIQQVDDTTNTFLTGIDRSTEELYRRIRPREFGSNLGSDFSTLTTESNRSWMFEDNTTSLYGGSPRFSNDTLDGVEYLHIGNVNGSYVEIGFVGTGLAVELADVSAAYTGNHTITLDGTDIVTLQPRVNTWGARGIKFFDLVSGLPYGYHTLRVTGQSSGTVREGFRSFLIYGPKKPSIPASAEVIGEYNLVADYVPLTAAGQSTVATGVIRKGPTREFRYEVGTWTYDASVNLHPNATHVFSNTSGATWRYNFFGEGFDWRMRVLGSVQLQINGLNATTANFPGLTFTTQGNASFDDSTGLATFGATLDGSSIAITGIGGFGYYEVTGTSTTASTNGVQAFDVITPVHVFDTAESKLTIDSTVPILQASEEAEIDLSKAKVLLVFDQVNNEILFSKNVAAVVDVNTGNSQIYFEKPFKNTNYVVMVSAAFNIDSDSSIARQYGYTFPYPNSVKIHAGTDTTALADHDRISVAIFGELEEEE